MLGVVEACALEPRGAGHRATVEHLRVRGGRSHVEEVPHGGPEIFESSTRRPPPERVVSVEREAGTGLAEVHELAQPSGGSRIRGWLPQHGGHSPSLARRGGYA